MSRHNPDGPDPIDLAVGLRLRGRRKELRMSQSKLAAALGISFQQVQKYERGANRVSASMLYYLAAILDVPITYFFDRIDEALGSALPVDHLLLTSDGAALAAAYQQIPEGPLRQIVLRLAEQLAALPLEH